MNGKHIHPARQTGATLIVVLILLLIVTLLGLATLRGTIMEERMTANLNDRNLAFQAAESALREGEALAQTRPTIPSSGCTTGVCATPVATDTDRWLDGSFAGWRNGTIALAGPALSPQFFIEYMGDAPTWPGCDLIDETNRSPLCLAPRYRITARVRSNDGSRAEVLLQTNYLVQ